MAEHDNSSGWFASAKDNQEYAEKARATVEAYRRGEITTAEVHEANHQAFEEHRAR